MGRKESRKFRWPCSATTENLRAIVYSRLGDDGIVELVADHSGLFRRLCDAAPVSRVIRTLTLHV